MKGPHHRHDADGQNTVTVPSSAVLGLLHADGTPITSDDCEAYAERLVLQNLRNAQDYETLMCDFDDDPRKAALIVELAGELKVGRAAVSAWEALGDVFRAVTE